MSRSGLKVYLLVTLSASPLDFSKYLESATARRGPRPQQFAHDRESGPAGLLIPKANAHCGPRRSTSQHRRYAAGFAGDQWKPVVELEAQDDLSHLQCTDLRRFRNSVMESLGRFLHSFPSPRFPRVSSNQERPGLEGRLCLSSRTRASLDEHYCSDECPAEC